MCDKVLSGVRRIAKRTLEEFEEVSKVSNTSIYLLCLASRSLILMILPRTWLHICFLSSFQFLVWSPVSFTFHSVSLFPFLVL